MTEISIANPAYARDGVSVDCEVDHPKLGLIPFTARSDDPEPFGAAVWAALQDMEIASYDGPAAPNPLHRDLSPREWGIFIDPDVTSFQAVIDAVLSAMPAGVERAGLRSRIERSQIYKLAETLALAEQVRALGLGVSVPTDTEIKSAWESVAGLGGVS